MRCRSRFLQLRVTLAVIAAAIAAAVPIVSATGKAQAMTCTSLMVIGARGSGQSYDGNDGMGPENYTAFQQVQQAVPDAQYFGLPYQAVALLPDPTMVLTSAYWTSVDLGAQILNSYVQQEIAACPYQRIAILGYSQGAHVVGNLLPFWGLDSNVTSHIAGIVLFGDPRFNPADPFDQGDYNSSLSGVFSARTISSTWWGKMRSYCHSQDFVCNWSSSNFASCPPWTTAQCGHFSYVASGAAAAGGAWLGHLIQGLPPLGSPQQPQPTTYSAAQMFIRGDSAVFARSGVGTSWTQETDAGTASQIASSSTGVQMLIAADSSVWAKRGISYGGWIQETTPGNATAIAVGGDTQMFLRSDGAVFATNYIGDNWVEETAPGTATAVAVSTTGLQMIITSDSQVWAKNSIGYGGWTTEVGPGNATRIAVGGNVQMFLRGDSAVFAQNGIGTTWTQETASATAEKIAVNDAGQQMMIAADASVWAKSSIGYGGWTTDVGPGNAWAIAAGSGQMLFARGDNALFANSCIGCGWTQETTSGNTAAIAAG